MTFWDGSFFLWVLCLVNGLCLGLGSLGHKRVAKALIPIDVYKLTNTQNQKREDEKIRAETQHGLKHGRAGYARLKKTEWNKGRKEKDNQVFFKRYWNNTLVVHLGNSLGSIRRLKRLPIETKKPRTPPKLPNLRYRTRIFKHSRKR